jgi:1-acyl-sn-glycerol-3-phosphate acyltransferase
MLDAIAYRSGRALVGAYARMMLDLDVAGHAGWPAGPFVVAANHPTTMDPVVLPSLVPARLSLLVTEMAFDAPVLGRYLRLAGHVPVVEGRGRAAFEAALAGLRRGGSVGVFPEGALSPLGGGVGPARTGAVRLALAAGVPLVPVGLAVDPARVCFREVTLCDRSETARWYPRGPYAVTVGAPLRLDGGLEDRERVRGIAESVMRRIEALATESAGRLAARAATPTTAAAGVRRAAAA